MSRMRSVDLGTGFADALRWIAPPSLPVCESAQVLDGGESGSPEDRRLETRTKTQSEWPFLYSYRGNTIIVNKAPFKSKYQEACAAGVALF
jgi:hypothetical protein